MPLGSLDSLQVFAEGALLISAAIVVSVLGRLVAERIAVPIAAVLLVAAAAFSDVFSGVGDVVSFEDVQWIASAALIVILFDGGLHIGRASFRRSVAEITALGVVGTFATAGLLTLAAHAALGFSWTTAGLIGAAIAPTDPAVTFSVLGGKEVKGRSGTILEGESGFNDPVGIALMIGMVEMATAGGSFWVVVKEFVVEMSVGLAVGVVGGVLLVWAMRRLQLPDALVPVWALGLVGVVFGLTGVLHGSGFLQSSSPGSWQATSRHPPGTRPSHLSGRWPTLPSLPSSSLSASPSAWARSPTGTSGGRASCSQPSLRLSLAPWSSGRCCFRRS